MVDKFSCKSKQEWQCRNCASVFLGDTMEWYKSRERFFHIPANGKAGKPSTQKCWLGWDMWSFPGENCRRFGVEKIACWLHGQGLICGNNLCKQKLGGFSLLLRSDVWSPLGEASLEQWKRGPWLFRVIIGDDATQLCGDYDKPLQGSLSNNQYNGRFFFMAHLLNWLVENGESDRLAWSTLLLWRMAKSSFSDSQCALGNPKT